MYKKQYLILAAIAAIIVFTTLFLLCHYCFTDNKAVLTDTNETVTKYVSKYRHPNQKPRQWDREIFCSDMDSITVCKWDSLSDSEKLHAIREAFVFNMSEEDWNKYSDEENLRILLSNTFIEW